jgi:hypothetical protein
MHPAIAPSRPKSPVMPTVNLLTSPPFRVRGGSPTRGLLASLILGRRCRRHVIREPSRHPDDIVLEMKLGEHDPHTMPPITSEKPRDATAPLR